MTGTEVLAAAESSTDQIARDLAGTGLAVLVTDEHGRITDRRVDGGALAVRLDAAGLTVGSVWTLTAAGRNAIGLALERREPAVVDGRDHDDPALADLTTASAPVVDPRNGTVHGTFALVCETDRSNVLLVPAARYGARDVAHELAGASSTRERRLNEVFLRARRHTRGPVVLVDGSVFLTNTAAARLFTSADHAALWKTASAAATRRSHEPIAVATASGGTVEGTIEVVRDLQPPAYLVHVRSSARGTGHSRRPHFGADALTDSERALADFVAEGYTNREIASRLFLSPHTVDAHLRQIFRKLGINSRVDLTRLVAAGLPTGDLVAV